MMESKRREVAFMITRRKEAGVVRKCRDPERGLAVFICFAGLCVMVLRAMELFGLPIFYGAVGFWRGLTLIGGFLALAIWASLTRQRNVIGGEATLTNHGWILILAGVLTVVGGSGIIVDGSHLLYREMPGFP